MKKKRKWIPGRWVNGRWVCGRYDDMPPQNLDMLSDQDLDRIVALRRYETERDWGLITFIDRIEDEDPELAKELRIEYGLGDYDAEFDVIDNEYWIDAEDESELDAFDQLDKWFNETYMVEPHLRTQSNEQLVLWPSEKSRDIPSADDIDSAEFSEIGKPIIGITSINNGCNSYVSSVRNAGGFAVKLTNVTQLNRVDGVIIPGGCDISPKWYGEESRHAVGIDEARDELEFDIAKECFSHNIPLLGICRGHQMITVAGGGKLYQDIDVERGNRGLEHRTSSHAHIVKFKIGSRVNNLKNKQYIVVNSYHHQATRVLPNGFSVTARATDGVVEAIESDNHRFIVGTQYHPEMLSSRKKSLVGKHASRIFNALIQASSESSGL